MGSDPREEYLRWPFGPGPAESGEVLSGPRAESGLACFGSGGLSKEFVPKGRVKVERFEKLNDKG